MSSGLAPGLADGRGELIVAGTGMRAAGQLTDETRGAIAWADRIFAAMPSHLSLHWLRGLAPQLESLSEFYARGRSRRETYRAMIDRIVGAVRGGDRVCALFYGHPGVFVHPSHAAIRALEATGHPARMLPGVSAEDALVADLGLDPARRGLASFEAMDFLLRPRRVEPTATLVLWQVGAVGDVGLDRFEADPRWLAALVERLAADYPLDHEVLLYEAALLPIWSPRIERLPLGALPRATLSDLTTLVVPSLGPAPMDEALLARLGVAREELG